MELLDDHQILGEEYKEVFFTVIDEPVKSENLETIMMLVSPFLIVLLWSYEIKIMAFLLFVSTTWFIVKYFRKETQELTLKIQKDQLVILNKERKKHQCQLKQIRVIDKGKETFVLKRRYWFFNWLMPTINSKKATVHPSYDELIAVLNT
jgi:hypothetical protein